MAVEEMKKVRIVRRTRATGGALLLPEKEYPVTKSDFLDLVRCGKGIDPTGKLKIEAPPLNQKDTGKEHPGGRGESTQEVGTRTVPGGEKAAKATAKDR